MKRIKILISVILLITMAISSSLFANTMASAYGLGDILNYIVDITNEQVYIADEAFVKLVTYTNPFGKPFRKSGFSTTYASGMLYGSIYAVYDASEDVIDKSWTDTFFSYNGTDYNEFTYMEIYGNLIPPETGRYTFYITANDYYMFKLGGYYLIKKPFEGKLVNSPSSEAKVSVNLTGGSAYKFLTEYWHVAGPGNIKIEWEGPNFSRRLLSGSFVKQ